MAVRVGAGGALIAQFASDGERRRWRRPALANADNSSNNYCRIYLSDTTPVGSGGALPVDDAPAEIALLRAVLQRLIRTPTLIRPSLRSGNLLPPIREKGAHRAQARLPGPK